MKKIILYLSIFIFLPGAVIVFSFYMAATRGGFLGDERPPEIERVIENLGIKKENILETLNYAYDMTMEEGEVGFETYVKMSREDWDNLKNKLNLQQGFSYKSEFQTVNPSLEKKVKKLNLNGYKEIYSNLKAGNEYIEVFATLYRTENKDYFLVTLEYQSHKK